jgi:dolichol-phosphate mannosyltransferase
MTHLIKRKTPELLSIVLPIYNEEDIIPILRKRLAQLHGVFPCPVEYILVDDGSHDRSLELLYEWSMADPAIKVVALSKNFGHQIAVTAGLDHAEGDAIVIMDADLQDPPELIPEMIEAYCEGYDVVYGQRTERKGETLFKKATARLFYIFMKKFIAGNLPENTGDFRLISRKVALELQQMGERDRFLRGMVSWIGHNQKAIFYFRDERAAGVTKYPLMKMIRLASNAAFSFSDLPLRIITWIGSATILLSIIMVLRVLFLKLFTDVKIEPGYASLIISIYFLAGVMIFSLGIIGSYIARIYTQVLDRPLYLVTHTFNLEKSSDEQENCNRPALYRSQFSRQMGRRNVA